MDLAQLLFKKTFLPFKKMFMPISQYMEAV